MKKKEYACFADVNKELTVADWEVDRPNHRGTNWAYCRWYCLSYYMYDELCRNKGATIQKNEAIQIVVVVVDNENDKNDDNGKKTTKKKERKWYYYNSTA